MREKRAESRNYLYMLVGGLFLVALAVVLGYSFLNTEGCVGVVEIKGELTSADSDSTLFSDAVKGSGTIAAEIAEADARPDVKSVLLLIESPGGSIVASREVYEAVKNASKPKVAYINELAASGGYYAAAPTDYIMANPNALTGSIGAIITLQDMSGLFEKVGYNMTSIVSGEKKDMGSPGRRLSDSERAVLQSIVDESFGEFRNSILESRGSRLNMSGFTDALDGRILSARQAKKIGLVDELGSKKQAVEKAAKLGGIKGEPRICEISYSIEYR
ncbi:MAG: signal peptide peptidase SppA [Candidatus Micrarchaeota archaeon]|nr:signal peptide peptidase SppA [Candidatus Micrarchaeota archaeon]